MNVVPKAIIKKSIIEDDEARQMLNAIGDLTYEIKDLIDRLERWADQSEDWDEQDRRMAGVSRIDEAIPVSEDLADALRWLREIAR
jgi:hypothetical protein